MICKECGQEVGSAESRGCFHCDPEGAAGRVDEECLEALNKAIDDKIVEDRWLQRSFDTYKMPAGGW